MHTALLLYDTLFLQQKRKLRLYISNTFNPAKPDAEDSDGSIASWELRVEGKLLDDVRAGPGLSGVPGWVWAEPGTELSVCTGDWESAGLGLGGGLGDSLRPEGYL